MSDFASRVTKMIDRLSDSVLAAAGTKVAEMLKEKVRENGALDTERLADSITWASAYAIDRSLIGSAALEGDIIKQPTEAKMVYVGTAVPYAPYVEYGSGAHVDHREQSAQFIENLKIWAERHGWVSRDGGELDEHDLWPLIKLIRERGTDERPFIRPVKAELESGGMSVIQSTVRQLMRKEIDAMPKGTSTIDVKIDLNGRE